MKLDLTVHTALDELRMQMLGTQVLFGFQFQGVFQEGFSATSRAAHIADIVAFGLLVVTLGCLLAAPAQHRLVERGVATARLFQTASRFAEVSLGTYAAAVGCDIFVVLESYAGRSASIVSGVAAFVVAISLWFFMGMFVKRHFGQGRTQMPQRKEPELHEKIDQMLTESRVILPGAQALLGFQFVVTMTKAFGSLPSPLQSLHFIALGCILLAVSLLIAPAAVHRMAFSGESTERMHDIGSGLITIALVPLALGIACDLDVAMTKVIPGTRYGLVAGIATFIFLGSLWYVVPLVIRSRLPAHSREKRTNT